MIAIPYRYEFEPRVSLDEAEQTLHLALYSVEGLYGSARVRTEASYHRHADEHAIIVDGSGDVGQSLIRIYTGLLIREFGEDAFHVRPAPISSSAPSTEPIHTSGAKQ